MALEIGERGGQGDDDDDDTDNLHTIKLGLHWNSAARLVGSDA